MPKTRKKEWEIALITMDELKHGTDLREVIAFKTLVPKMAQNRISRLEDTKRQRAPRMAQERISRLEDPKHKEAKYVRDDKASPFALHMCLEEKEGEYKCYWETRKYVPCVLFGTMPG